MRILIVTHFYPPEMGGAAARLHGLARWLAEFGHSVTVITGFPNYPSGVIRQAYRGRWQMTETIDGVNVIRTWVYASSHKNSWRRLANYLSFVMTGTYAGLTKTSGYDIVLASSPPLFVGLAGVALVFIKRVPLVFDIRDLWPEVAIEAGILTAESATAKFMTYLAQFLYKQSHHVTAVTKLKQEKLCRAGVSPTKQSIVTNGVDLDTVRNLPRADIRAELGLEDKFIVLYAGLIGIAQGVEIAVEAAKLLQTHADIHFLIVGDGVRRDALAALINQHNLNNISLVPEQPRDRIPSFLAAANLCLVSLISQKIDDAVPSKLLEAWACGRPIILVASGEAANIVHRCKGGLVVPPQNPTMLAKSVLDLQSNPAQLLQYGQRGQAYVRQSFDRQSLAKQMEYVLESTIESHLNSQPQIRIS